MSAAPPRWTRALLALDRGWQALAGVEGVVRDELLCGLVPPAQRDALTTWCYARRGTYLPDGVLHRGGLFEWERAAIARPPFPASGALLLGGAGGGREIAGLCAAGYRVVAFEPSAALVAGARAVADAHSGARALRASYADLVRAAAAGDGPLAAVLDETFDGVVLGWGSLSHVVAPADRVALFRALRRLAPGAPVLASFIGGPAFEPRGRAEQLRRGLRAALRRAGAPGAGAPGLRFSPDAGFHVALSAEVIAAEAAAAEYRVAWSAATPYPHLLLAPAHAEAH